MQNDVNIGSACIVSLGNNRYRCKNRGFEFTTDVLPIHCVCDIEKQAAPSESTLTEAAERLSVTLDDVKHYAQAVARWAAAGFPTRSPEEVTRIYEECCEPCDSNVDGKCKECGCNVSESRFVLRNKIKMKTETCPLGKWRSDRDQWDQIVQTTLTAWLNDPNQLQEDDLESPSQHVITRARDVSLAMRDQEVPPPLRIVSDGDGGIAVEWEAGATFATYQIDADGTEEFVVLVNSCLVRRLTNPNARDVKTVLDDLVGKT